MMNKERMGEEEAQEHFKHCCRDNINWIYEIQHTVTEIGDRLLSFEGTCPKCKINYQDISIYRYVETLANKIAHIHLAIGHEQEDPKTQEHFKKCCKDNIEWNNIHVKWDEIRKGIQILDKKYWGIKDLVRCVV